MNSEYTRSYSLGNAFSVDYVDANRTMIRTSIDAEWKISYKDDGKIDGSAFNPENYLVSVGFKQTDDIGTLSDYLFFQHNELKTPNPNNKYILQEVLDETELLIGHNLKADLGWLRECGFRYNGPCWDTMVWEYVYNRAVKLGLSLEEVCKRRKVQLKKSKLIQDYKDKGIGFEAMPLELVREYGFGDVVSADELWQAQWKLLSEPSNDCLIPTLRMSNELMSLLTDIERNGMFIDVDELVKIEKEYTQEKIVLERDINKIVSQVMGDMPINLNSGEQLSQVIYSRKVIDKHKWAETFHLGLDDRGKPLYRPRMDTALLRHNILKNTQLLQKVKAEQCSFCYGSGRIEKITKKGEVYKNLPRCTECLGTGILYKQLGTRAGLGLGPRNIFDITAGGFSTSSDTLDYFSKLPNVSGTAKELLTKLVRLNAVETYLSTFVGGIKRGVRSNGILHASLNQCVTSTGRLSGTQPNMQNFPRGLTFPVKRCIKSRFENGLIIEADAVQLEFRVAQELSKCPIMLSDILDPTFDAHLFSSKTLTDAGEPTNRQDAKPHTFKPLYGGTSGTLAQQTYYRAFMDRYEGLRTWHEWLLDTAVSKHVIRLPTGREYKFPLAERTKNGWVTQSTQIKNFPVQGFATADLIPCVLLILQDLFKEHRVKSLIINTVHDSVIVDTILEEKELVVELLVQAFKELPNSIKRRYNYELTCPLGVEVKGGGDWLNMSEITKVNKF